MWWEWVKRAHDGGLRVMVALTVNSELLAEILNGSPPYDDRSVAERQIAETIRMVNNHRDFMEVATSSADVMRIVAEGKLAVVLGMEVDRIGNWGAQSSPGDSEVRDEIRHLHDLGIRYAFPVHLVDNAFGGSAVYSPLFSFANKRANGYHSLVQHSADPDVTYNAGEIEGIPITHGLGNMSVTLLRGLMDAIGDLPTTCTDFSSFPPCIGQVWCCGSYRETTALLAPSPEIEAYKDILPGHVNVKGLAPAGAVAIDEMMKLGMFIDLDHMSQRTQEQVIQMAEAAGAVTGGPGYPLMFGHGGLREPGSSERLPPRALVERVKALGGMFGAGTADATPDQFIQTFQGLRTVMDAGSVAIGTDINGFEKSPRRSEDCQIGAGAGASQQFYQRFLSESGLTTRSTLGNRTWDYVLDCGVSHYGLMPEFLFDVGTFHGDAGEAVRDDLMKSVGGFIKTWQRIESASARLQ
jgi:microsomal dipeptidase-like Zn-dependent dipeptidase